MGLSDTVSHFIWFFAIVACAGLVVKAVDVFEEVEDAREARDLLESERLGTRFADATFCHNEFTEELTFYAWNAGTVYLARERITFLVDGALVEDFVPEGSTSLWAPGELATFTRAGQVEEPGAVTFATGAGVVAYASASSCPTLSLIVVTPSSADMQIGGEQVFSAQGFNQYGEPIADLTFAWQTLAGDVEVLNATMIRLTAGTVSGAFAVTATAEGVSGEADIEIWPGAPVSLAVSPSDVDVVAGGTQTFTTTLLDAYGNENTTTNVAWSTNAGAIDANGVLTAQTTTATGRSVTATAGALSDAATVDIVPGPVARIAVAPATASLLAGATQAFTASAFDAYDNAIPSATFSWSATRGVVDATGLYTAPATRGPDTVRATSGGVDGTSAVTVRQNVHVSDITTYLDGVATGTFVRGTTVETRVTVRDHNGALVEGVTVTVEFVRPNAQVAATESDATDAAGIASMSHLIPSNAQPGTWNVRVTGITGTNAQYVSASNVETSQTFTVTT